MNVKKLSKEMNSHLLRLKGPSHVIFGKKGEGRTFGYLYNYVEYYYFLIKFLLENGNFKFMVVYTVISVLGLTVSEIAYSFHLLDLVV